MELHGNAALSWSGRRELARRVVDQGWTVHVSGSAATRPAIARRELHDRSSAPRRVANRTPAERVAVILKLRRLRMTAAEIAETLAMPHSTVSALLKRNGLGRLGFEPAVRYERARAGELVHIDVKKLGRFQAAGHRVGLPPHPRGQTSPPRRARPRPRHQRLGVRPRRHRRLLAARLRRGAAR